MPSRSGGPGISSRARAPSESRTYHERHGKLIPKPYRRPAHRSVTDLPSAESPTMRVTAEQVSDINVGLEPTLIVLAGGR